MVSKKLVLHGLMVAKMDGKFEWKVSERSLGKLFTFETWSSTNDATIRTSITRSKSQLIQISKKQKINGLKCLILMWFYQIYIIKRYFWKMKSFLKDISYSLPLSLYHSRFVKTSKYCFQEVLFNIKEMRRQDIEHFLKKPI